MMTCGDYIMIHRFRFPASPTSSALNEWNASRKKNYYHLGELFFTLTATTTLVWGAHLVIIWRSSSTPPPPMAENRFLYGLLFSCGSKRNLWNDFTIFPITFMRISRWQTRGMGFRESQKIELHFRSIGAFEAPGVYIWQMEFVRWAALI